jgi:hypothetical protein
MFALDAKTVSVLKRTTLLENALRSSVQCQKHTVAALCLCVHQLYQLYYTVAHTVVLCWH